LIMKAKEHLFDISTKESRMNTVCCIADILYEIYLAEEENLQQQLFELDCHGHDESNEGNTTKYIMDELIDMVVDLACLYE